MLLLPSLSIGFVYTHALAKAAIIILLVFNVVQGIVTSKRKEFTIPKELIFLLGFYCVRILFSFVHEESSLLWDTVETQVFFALLVLYVSQVFITKKAQKSHLIRALTRVFIAYTVLNYVLYLFKDSFLLILQPLLHEGTYSIIQMNLDRGRLFFDNYPELLIPLLIANKYIDPRIKWGGVGVTLFIVLASGFRTNFVMAIFAVFASLLVFYRQKSLLMMKRMNKSLGRVIVIIVTILGIGVGLMGVVETGYLKNNALERLLSDEQAERSTIEGRLEYIRLGTELFASNPLIGVGTNAFRDYLTVRKDRHSIKRANIEIFDDARDPHQFFVTILSEGGVIAMGLYTLFLIYAFRSDWKRKTVGSILFWTLFLYGMANPVATSIHFNLLLILYRFI